MPLNTQTAATARLAQLPLVRSACASLSVLYGDAKSRNPGLRFVCERLESSAALFTSGARHRVSPVLTKFKPQVSFADDVACKSLDWLEATFPVLHTSTDQLVAGVRSKVLEMQDAVTIAAHGTVDCVQHAVTCIVERVQQPDDLSLVGRAVAASSMGLASALNLSEALVDRMLTEEEKQEEDVVVEGSEAAASVRRYSVRLVTLSITLCRRTIQLAGAKMQSTQIMGAFSTSSSQLHILLALAWSLEQLPLHVQQQIVSVFFYFTQMFNLGVAEQSCSKQDRSVCLSAGAPEATSTPHKVIKYSSRPNSNWQARRTASICVFESRLTPLGKGEGTVDSFH
ncbi:perilipin-2-like isoform X2 [Phyllopteryx taeniolatus]|uniref:perilipin-2-like isoform X2 n=1 Tax=Phyllopteryx taeniolatus TaxID=161469 RepID=UPI002AD56E80|nr:perilipin-2-like isoform X2 [Phyllopteryx taeniolatus]